MMPYFILLMITAAISVILSYLSLGKPKTAGSKPFSVLMLAVAIWSFAYGFGFEYLDSANMVIYSKISFFGIALSPVLWVWFVLEYTGRERYINGKLFSALLIIPAVTILIISSNDVYSLYYTYDSMVFPVQNGYGPWYYVHKAYSYLLIISGLFYLSKVYIESPDYYRPGILLVIVGAFLPLIGNFIYASGMIPGLFFDITPFFFLLTGVIVYTGVFRQNSPEIMPVVYGNLIKVMKDSVFVLDGSDTIVDVNPSGVLLTGKNRDLLVGQKIYCFFSFMHDLKNRYPGCDTIDDVAEFYHNGVFRCYSVSITPLFAGSSENNGRLLIIRDISENKISENALRSSEHKYRTLFNNIKDGVILHRISESGILGEIIDVNDFACSLFEMSKAELCKINGEQISGVIVYEHDLARLNRLLDTGYVSFETSFVRKDGLKLPVIVSSHIFSLGGEEIVLSLVRDISSQKEIQKREMSALLQIEKNIEQMSLLNDNIRNPLAVIVGLSSLDDTNHSRIIIEESHKIDEIVKKLDLGCLESEKIRQFLMKHYNFKLYCGDEPD
ncbi:histidine kinase N-terminal 7TM domain-containing protein [Methanochimaera problematica]|nr:histidine kinase N-terminal 7TM domain-containing protein [Methanoplanus sp. FWC-SCC4]